MSFALNTSHNNVIRARGKELFAKKIVQNSIGFIGVAGLVLGAVLLLSGIQIGWLCFIFPVVTFMLHEWYRHDLLAQRTIQSTLPEDRLKSDILALMPNAVENADQLIEVLKKSADFWFIANRLDLPASVASGIRLGSQWWDYALSISDDGVEITAADCLVAVLITSPDKQDVLRHLQCSEQDILDVLAWFKYVQHLLTIVGARKHAGGIARDWSAGYTPLLDSFATNLSQLISRGGIAQREISGHTNVISQMRSIFSSNGKANIALVGEVGVGKATCVQAFAESLLFENSTAPIAYNQVYQVDSIALATKIPSNQLDYTIQRLAAESYHAKNIVLYFDNAGSFFGYQGSTIDATSSILPILENSGVRMIFSFTQNEWQYIQKNKPQLAAILNYQVVTPTDEHDTIRILENQVLFTENQYKSLFTYASLKEVYRLANRYGPEIAMPGRAISVLEDVAHTMQGSYISAQDVQTTIEQTTGIKIATASGDEKSILLSLEDMLRQRVVGQDEAVRQIVNALKRSRTGVGNPNRPIGTFLFLGPTGVGKTELSKALADTYFGGQSGFVRVDMNEYITQDSIHKLLAGTSEGGTTFLETIKKQPFSVVLLDELEKAHPDIVNSLLQLLDEGEIKDNDNRTVSFKDTIIIATSNAGAAEIRAQIQSGTTLEVLSRSLADTLISNGVFKPEFINRFDDVIVFSPLTKEHLSQIITIQMGAINETLKNQGISVSLTDDAVAWLMSQGYDERLGARPLRRMMQKTIETAVSNIMLQQQVAHGTTITLDAAALQSAV